MSELAHDSDQDIDQKHRRRSRVAAIVAGFALPAITEGFLASRASAQPISAESAEIAHSAETANPARFLVSMNEAEEKLMKEFLAAKPVNVKKNNPTVKAFFDNADPDCNVYDLMEHSHTYPGRYDHLRMIINRDDKMPISIVLALGSKQKGYNLKTLPQAVSSSTLIRYVSGDSFDWGSAALFLAPPKPKKPRVVEIGVNDPGVTNPSTISFTDTPKLAKNKVNTFQGSVDAYIKRAHR